MVNYLIAFSTGMIQLGVVTQERRNVRDTQSFGCPAESQFPATVPGEVVKS